MNFENDGGQTRHLREYTNNCDLPSMYVQVLEAIESVNSEDEGGQEDGLDLSKDNI